MFDASQGEKGMFKYWWRALIAHLEDASMEEVVNAPTLRRRCGVWPDGRNGGIVKCEVRAFLGNEDRSRYGHARNTNTDPTVSPPRYPQWDFGFTRVDGSQIAVHPQWKRRTLRYANLPFQSNWESLAPLNDLQPVE